jgi:hypothetical protein
MDWIQDNLQLVIAVAGAIAYWLTQRKKEQAGEPTDYDGDGRPDNLPREAQFEDPELAERTRRIREEIQKKIDERRRGGAGYDRPAAPQAESPFQQEEPPPVIVQQELPPPLVREVVVRQASTAAADAAAARRMAEMKEQQEALAEQLKQAEEMKAAALRRREFETSVSAEKTAQDAKRATLVEELRNPESARRAIILREILGPPVALRG